MVFVKLDEFPDHTSCQFCLSRRSDEVELGEIANIGDLYCHYFCLLLANKVLQRGSDNQGILGFLPKDIKKEILRGKRLCCDYCKKKGATIACWETKCKIRFHLPCGLKKGSLHQFFGNFSSYCKKHRPRQKIPPKVLGSSQDCVVCTSPVQRNSPCIWPECCKPSTLIHKRCLQKMATSHGYYFKCPLCNNSSRFVNEAKRLGIFIPERDPTWEMEEGAFQELYHTIPCEMGTNCLCEHGPSYSRVATRWKLEKCILCGGTAIHLACSKDWVPGSSFSMSWKCGTCSAAESVTALQPPAGNTDPESGEDMEIIVDVETISEDDPPLLPSQSYFRTHKTDCDTPLPYVTLERLHPDCFSGLPIIISDSDDEVEVLSISSTEDSSSPLRPTNSSTGLSNHVSKVSEVIEID